MMYIGGSIFLFLFLVLLLFISSYLCNEKIIVDNVDDKFLMITEFGAYKKKNYKPKFIWFHKIVVITTVLFFISFAFTCYILPSVFLYSVDSSKF